MAVLGPADRVSDLRLAYDLGTRPGYLYEFRFVSSGKYVGAGFVREGPRPSAPDIKDRASLPSRLAEMGATADEVQDWLGTPIETMGWWPIEDWDYGDGLIIEMRHGIVEED